MLALDTSYGGGATALSGGVVYLGGGTKTQQEAGVEDSVANMLDYLREETAGVVSEDTLRSFCEASPETEAWLRDLGVKFQGNLAPIKTSYPVDKYTLYYSGNEQAWPWNEIAKPAPRGHRHAGNGLAAGKLLFQALHDAAIVEGVEFHSLSRVTELLTKDGQVRGVSYLRTDPSELPTGHQKLSWAADKLSNWAPVVGRGLTRLSQTMVNRRQRPVEATAAAVLIAAGGFVYNDQLRAQHAGGYRNITPLGTPRDDGSGIQLAQSVGGQVGHLERMTAWRFLTPPVAMLKGIAVGPTGKRIAAEDRYGATFAKDMVANHNSQGWLILDATMWAAARSQLLSQCQSFQLAQLAYLMSVGHTKADTLAELGGRIRVNPEALAATVAEANRTLHDGEPDPMHKADAYRAPLETGPFYAVDISVKNAPLFPAAGITLGGLVVDETTGQVCKDNGAGLPGLYAAGRSAVGVCTNGYISGLSIADAIFSGRRAARAVARAVGS